MHHLQQEVQGTDGPETRADDSPEGGFQWTCERLLSSSAGKPNPAPFYTSTAWVSSVGGGDPPVLLHLMFPGFVELMLEDQVSTTWFAADGQSFEL